MRARTPHRELEVEEDRLVAVEEDVVEAGIAVEDRGRAVGHPPEDVVETIADAARQRHRFGADAVLPLPFQHGQPRGVDRRHRGLIHRAARRRQPRERVPEPPGVSHQRGVQPDEAVDDAVASTGVTPAT